MYAILKAGVFVFLCWAHTIGRYTQFFVQTMLSTFTRYLLRYAWRCGCGPEICVTVDQFADPDHDFVIAFDKFPVIIKVCLGIVRSRLRVYR